ncbi:unnamed protein product [Mytilus coruscus]|uniref:Uncharacterized protein n=1 Tax=Mytilus coruscus TaxID=42192 RepID=A0A6J8BNL3_MYTCO|nr:unnamed protein product [Mytilus coruscus]
MQQTIILHPLEGHDTLKGSINLIGTKYMTLVAMNDGENISFQEFLEKVALKDPDYILAVRSSIAAPTVFLKRSLQEVRVNSYSAACLKAWRANMDLQFVIDVYACAIYIASYITKTQRGMSELLTAACKEANSGNKTIREQVRLISKNFLNAFEISAQEASYLSLQLPLKKSSRQVIFINTSPPDQRVVLLKPQNQLQSMND